MRINKTISKMSPGQGKLRLIAVTMLVLIVPFFIYYTFYVQKQDVYFTNRALRALALVSSHLTTRVESLSVVFENAARKFTDPENKETLEAILQNLKDDGLEIFPVSPGPKSGGQVEDGRARGVTINLKQESGLHWLYFDFLSEDGKVRVQGKTDLDRLVGLLVGKRSIEVLKGAGSEGEFDNILIAQAGAEGRVIFQQDTAGLRLTSLDSLSAADDEGKKIDFSVVSKTSNVVDVKLAGAKYKLFLHPISLAVSRTGAPADAGTQWVACALVPLARFKKDVWAISYTELIFIVFITALAVLSWPFLKLAFIGPKDRLRTTDIYFLAFSMLIGMALLTSFCLYVYSYSRLEGQMDGQLEKLGARMKSNFQDELGMALEELDELNQDVQVREALAEMLKTPDANVNESARSNIFPKLLDEKRPYPYFDTAVWIDAGGDQRLKRTIKNSTTHLINVSERPYFRNLREGRYHHYAGRDKEHEFWLEPILSRTTGRHEVEISKQVTDPELRGWVLAFDTRLLSLMQPIFPVGYGYAVLDGEGKVLFHSDESHHLGENFFQECDNDPTLRSAVTNRARMWLNVQYLGRGHRVFVTPLENFPAWSLVVFRDKQVLRTTFLELLTFDSLLFLTYSLILSFGLSIFHLFNINRNMRRAWLWPSDVRTPVYYLSAAVLFALSLVCSLVVVTLHGLWAVITVALISFFGIIFFFLNLRFGRWRQTPGGGGLTPRRGKTLRRGKTFGALKLPGGSEIPYVLNIAFLLLLTAILPSVIFFKVAYESEMALLIKHGQSTMADGLSEREERVRNQYGSKGGGRNDPSIKEFIARRLGRGWDVYDAPFFETRRSASDDVSACLGERPSGFITFVNSFMPRYNYTSGDKRGLYGEPFADDSRWWEVGQAGRLVLHRAPGPGEKAGWHMDTQVPDFGVPGPFWWAIALGAFLPFFLWIRLAVRKVFLLDLHKPTSLTLKDLSAGKIKGNTFIILDEPYTQREPRGLDPFHLIDLKDTADAPDWAEGFDYGRLQRTAKNGVVVDHFDYRMDEPEANRQKTRFLENLLSRGQKVMVISAVEPTRYHFTNGAGGQAAGSNSSRASEVLDRWAGVISRLYQFYVEDSGDQKRFAEEVRDWRQAAASQTSRPQAELDELAQTLEEECRAKSPLQHIGREILRQHGFAELSREHLINRITIQAAAYYQIVWESCSNEERLTLFHLAEDRLLSPSDPQIEQLLRRGLIVRDPDLHLMSESFRRFVKLEKGGQVIAEYEEEAKRGSLWRTLSPPLLVVLSSVVLFLFITQRELYNSSLAIMTAITTAIPALFKLLNVFHKDPLSYKDYRAPEVSAD